MVVYAGYRVCGLPCKYSIDVKNVRLGIPYRQYIWLGGIFPATHVNAGQEWCFAYGEQEWGGDQSFDQVRTEADSFDIAGRPQLPVGQIGCP